MANVIPLIIHSALLLLAPGRGRPDPVATPVLADPPDQDEGEVREGLRGLGARARRVHQGGRRPQPLAGGGGEAADELDAEEPAVRRRQERVRQPAAEDQRVPGESMRTE